MFAIKRDDALIALHQITASYHEIRCFFSSLFYKTFVSLRGILKLPKYTLKNAFLFLCSWMVVQRYWTISDCLFWFRKLFISAHYFNNIIFLNDTDGFLVHWIELNKKESKWFTWIWIFLTWNRCKYEKVLLHIKLIKKTIPQIHCLNFLHDFLLYITFILYIFTL